MSWRWISIAAVLAAVVIGFGVLSGRDPVADVASEMPPQPAYYLKDAIITETEQDWRAHRAPDRRAHRTAAAVTAASSCKRCASTISRCPTSAGSCRRSAASFLLIRVSYSSRQCRTATDRWAGVDFSARRMNSPSTATGISLTRPPRPWRSASAPIDERETFEADLKTEKVRMEAVHGRSEAG